MDLHLIRSQGTYVLPVTALSYPHLVLVDLCVFLSPFPSPDFGAESEFPSYFRHSVARHRSLSRFAYVKKTPNRYLVKFHVRNI